MMPGALTQLPTYEARSINPFVVKHGICVSNCDIIDGICLAS